MEQETTVGAGQEPELAGGGGELAPEDGERALQEALSRAAQAEARAEELLAQLQRLKADFDNYRRRMMQEQSRWQETAVAGFLRELLPVLDNLERALASSQGADGARGSEALRQGLELTLRQFHAVLERAGLVPIPAVGQPFDPTQHEAMMRVDGPGYAEDTVVEEFQRGYIFKGHVLRPALVKVAVALPAAEAAGDTVSAPEDCSGGGE